MSESDNARSQKEKRRPYWWWLFLVAVVGLVLTKCSDNRSWKEEVRLLDGRIITVTQKRRYQGAYDGQSSGTVPREAWLTLKLPEFGDQEIVWHEQLEPRIVNIYEGKLYVVGCPPTGLEDHLYGKPRPPYIGFRYEAEGWQRIPFAEIPLAIYDTNLWIENEPPNDSGFVSFADKAAEMKKRTLDQDLKRIDPNYQ